MTRVPDPPVSQARVTTTHGATMPRMGGTSSLVALKWIALVTAAVDAAAWITLLVFFVVGGPFGTINDVANAALAVLAAALVLGCLRITAGDGLIRVARVSAAAGGVVMVAGRCSSSPTSPASTSPAWCPRWERR